MIDEELYQQAADELNSDRRRAHIWARACALSKDDHDEARYLYTNLRVEELIAERESSLDTADDALSMEQDVPLTLDPTPTSIPPTGVLPLDDTLEFGDDSTLSIDSAPSLPSDSGLQLDPAPIMPEIASGGAPLSPMEREYYEKHPEQLKELEESKVTESIQQGNQDLDLILDGIESINYGDDDKSNILSADFTNAEFTPVDENPGVLVNDEMDWLDSDAQADDSHGAHDSQGNDFQTNLQHFDPQTPAVDETDRFTQDLLRQVDELPGQHSDVVSSNELHQEESTWEPSPRANEAAVGTAAAIGAARYGHVENNHNHRSIGATDSLRLPIDLTDGKSGTEYTVFRRDQKIQAVKEGVSWSALFFTVPYLIYRHMFGTAIVYTIMSLIVAAGLIFMGLSWIDAGASASNLIKLTTVGFGLLAVVGILYLPFRHGNSWRSEKLEQRGFELVARVKAGNPGKAVALARRASALD